MKSDLKILENDSSNNVLHVALRQALLIASRWSALPHDAWYFLSFFFIATSLSILLGWRKAGADFICWDGKLAYRLSYCEVSMHELESAACFNPEYEFDDNDKF